MIHIQKTDPELYEAIFSELKRQRENLELIASENFTSLAVMEAQGSVLTINTPKAILIAGAKKRPDQLQALWTLLWRLRIHRRRGTLAIERAKQLFGAEHANVQAHSGSRPIWQLILRFANRATPFSLWNFRMAGILRMVIRYPFPASFTT
jgi:glycine hydroxymethyltransferase